MGAMEPQYRYARTPDGVNIAWYEMGEGMPLVLASYVLYSDLRRVVMPHEFHRMGRGIGRGLRIVRYDSRGAGLSDRDALDFSLEARVRDLETVVAAAELDRFALLASVHGTYGAVAYAARHAERVSHLILHNPFAARGTVVRDRITKRWDSIRAQAGEDWETYAMTMASVNSRWAEPDNIRETAEAYRNAMTPAAVVAYTESVPTIDVSEMLARVHAPTLVLVRPVNSPEDMLEFAREITGAIPNARLVTGEPYRPGRYWDRASTAAVEEFLGVGDGAPAPPAASPPARAGGLRTIVFTDVERNTELLQRLGDAAWRELLREHERITREQIAAHGGAEVKAMGDGFMASFPSVTQALDCATAVQRALGERNAASDVPLRVRIGVNAGEPIEEEDDLFGTAVTMAARIASEAAGGEVLVSDVVRQLASGKGYMFGDRGPRSLRGFDDPVRVYELRVAESQGTG